MILSKFKFSILFVFFISLTIINISVYSQDDSILDAIPAKAIACIKFTGLKNLDSKITYMMNSLEITNNPPTNVASLISKMTKMNLKSLADIENAGFDLKKDVCLFWTDQSFSKFSIVARVKSKDRVMDAAKQMLGGANKQHNKVTYLSNNDFDWTVMGDIFVYTKDKTAIIDIINTHNKANASILKVGKYITSTEVINSGDINCYIDLAKIMGEYLPKMQTKIQETKADLSKQMSKPGIQSFQGNFNHIKILGAEMDMASWLLQQMDSYVVSLGLDSDSIWISDSLKFKPESPVKNFLNMNPKKLELVNYLPGNMLMAGSFNFDRLTLEQFNNIMFDALISSIKDGIKDSDLKEIKEKYNTATNQMLSCIGDEVAFAMPARTDKSMPRLIYLFRITDENKARSTITNPGYMNDMYGSIYKLMGMEFSITEGPSQIYNDVQMNSLQLVLKGIPKNIQNAENIYPESIILWFAYLDDKLVYVLSQSSETIKEAIDIIKGRASSIVDSRGFDDVNIRLSDLNNSVIYISPSGYMNFIIDMMSKMTIPGGPQAKLLEYNIGAAMTTKFQEDSVRNFTYILLDQIREVANTIRLMSQMAKPKAITQPPKMGK